MDPIARERDRLLRHLGTILWRPSDEFPTRVHSRDVEGALGGLAWHPEFAGYLRDAGVCFCEGEHRCQAPVSRHAPTTRRLRRAFRQLRGISPEAYDACWLLIMQRVPYREMVDRINGSRERRGLPRLSDEEIALFVISGIDILIHAW